MRWRRRRRDKRRRWRDKRQRWRDWSRETWAVLWLTAGSVLLVVGWLVGVGLLWRSTRWTRAEKWLGTLVTPGGPGLALWLFVAYGSTDCVSTTYAGPAGPVTTQDCTGLDIPATVGVPIGMVILLAPLVVGTVLLARLRSPGLSRR